MKTKLSTFVVATLLAGCGSDGNDPQQQVQAFDGAIQGIAGTYSCIEGSQTESGTLPKTGYDGFSTVTTSLDSLLFTNPSRCIFTFNPTPGAVDVSNGKSMAEVSLSIPRGLAGSGTKIAATPLSTLVAQTLDGAEYTEASAVQVLTLLGLGDVLNSGLVTATEIMTNLDGAMATLKNSADDDTKRLAGKLTATTHVLTDVLVKKGSLTATQTALLAKNLTLTETANNPYYPASGATGTGSDVVVDVKTAIEHILQNSGTLSTMTNPLTTIDDIPEEVKTDVAAGENPSEPVDPNPGTGTGTGTGGGSTGD
ncbi:hypothetical protein V9N52_004076 [Vibrio navarrensis]